MKRLSLILTIFAVWALVLVACTGTPTEIDSLIREEIEKLGCKDGGLMMTYG